MLTKKCVYVFVFTFFYKNKIENQKKNIEKKQNLTKKGIKK